MSANSSIEWTERTWNPITGCTKVSQGCKNCYAETVANRFWGDRKFTDITVHFDRLRQPLKWKKPSKIFVNSMSDLFHEVIPTSCIIDILEVMRAAKWHTFQVLTKRPNRMKQVVGLWIDLMKLGDYQEHVKHIWLGVSVEDQKTADERIPLLLQTPAAVRWVSYEPALEAVDFGFENRRNVDWVVVGGESGPKARLFDIGWAQSAVVQCQDAKIPVFVKQLGAKPYYQDENGVEYMLGLKSRKGGDMNEWPPELRIREYPQ